MVSKISLIFALLESSINFFYFLDEKLTVPQSGIIFQGRPKILRTISRRKIMGQVIDNRLNKHQGLIKALIFVAFVISAIVLIRFTPIKNYLTTEALTAFLETAGLWAPVAYIIIYAVGVCLFLPGTLLTALGAAIFGAYWGFVYVWIAAMLGSSGAFLIGRTLAREFAASLVGEKLKKYDDAIERNGFATVLYLRLVYFPFTPMNFGMGITKVRFKDYIFGTGLGIIVGTFIFTFFIGTLKEVWGTGNWGELISFKVFFSIALFVFSFFIPKIIKKFKGEGS